MDELELERLYLLYKSGVISDGNAKTPAAIRLNNGDILKIAQAVANDLTKEEFTYIVSKVSELHTERDERFQQAIPEKDENGNPILKRTNSMPQREFQERLWSIADQAFSRPFQLEKLSPGDVRKQFADEANEDAFAKSDIDLSKIESMVQKPTKPPVEAPPIVKQPMLDAGKLLDSGKAGIIEDPLKLEPLNAADIWKSIQQLAGSKSQQANSSSPDKPASKPSPSSPSISGTVASNGIELEPIDFKDFWKSVQQTAGSPNSQQDESIGGSPVDRASAGAGGLLDGLQTILDGVGVVDPTPVADGTNVVISLARAALDPQHAGKHLANAGTSAISLIPFVGDIAKVFKYGGKGAKLGAEGAEAVAKGSKSNWGGIASSVGQFIGGLGGGSSGSAGSGTPDASGGGSGSGGASVGGFGGGTGVPPGGGTGGQGSGGWSMSQWAVVGTAIAAAAHELWSRYQSFKQFSQPSKYRGNSFDAFTETMDKGSQLHNAVTPSVLKLNPFSFALDFATKQLKGWVDWLKRTEEAGNAMLESQRHLAQYNGTVGLAFAQLDVDRIRRDIGKAESMGGNIKDLSRSQSAFEAAKQDLFQPFEKLQMFLQSRLLDLGTVVMKAVDGVEIISETINWWLGKEQTNQARSALEFSIQQQMNKQKDKL